MNGILMAFIFIALRGPGPAVRPSPSPRAVIEAKFAAVNRHAVTDIVKLYSPGARVTSSGFCTPRQGRADVQRTYQYLIGTVPDIAAEVVSTLSRDPASR